MQTVQIMSEKMVGTKGVSALLSGVEKMEADVANDNMD